MYKFILQRVNIALNIDNIYNGLPQGRNLGLSCKSVLLLRFQTNLDENKCKSTTIMYYIRRQGAIIRERI